MDIIYILKDFIKCKGNIDTFLKNRVVSIHQYGYRTVPLNTELMQIDGIKYNLANSYMRNMITWDEVHNGYCFDDLRHTDIVLDIGANVGLFSLAVHNHVKKVYAVEPLFIKELSKNINLNDFSIDILPYALSTSDIEVSYADKKSIASGKTLQELIHLAGGHVDFIKIDCEGGEWIIQPDELEGVRRIEGELHSFNGENMDDFVSMLQSVGFDVKISDRDSGTMLIHATRNPIIKEGVKDEN